MRAALLPTPVIVATLLAGCGAGPETPASTTSESPPAPAASLREPAPISTPPPTPAAEPPPTDEPLEEIPPELAARIPPDEEIDRMVREAQSAYAAHRAVYDAAARTGFRDAELVDELFATASGDTLDALQGEATAIAQAERVVDGAAQIVGSELYSLVLPDENGDGLAVVLEVCLLIEGTLRESDGTVVLELGGEPVHAHVRLVDHAGSWLLVTQRVQDTPCPPALNPP